MDTLGKIFEFQGNSWTFSFDCKRDVLSFWDGLFSKNPSPFAEVKAIKTSHSQFVPVLLPFDGFWRTQKKSLPSLLWPQSPSQNQVTERGNGLTQKRIFKRGQTEGGRA